MTILIGASGVTGSSCGQLASPDEAARRVLAWLQRPDFGDPVVADVREAD